MGVSALEGGEHRRLARAPMVPVGEGGPTRADAEGGDGGRVEAGNGFAATTPMEPPTSLGEFLDTDRHLFWRRHRCLRTGGCIHGRCLLVHHGRRDQVVRTHQRRDQAATARCHFDREKEALEA
ncbi:uncharacterized protein [Triticum aestivum]|uniref:uncharacterized protein n=1 Tax=Triticum aestivum TaxID=4565 RepID=UPI001D0071A8|nr:uncharacterized protein LOC123060817 [Triticum aestivum]